MSVELPARRFRRRPRPRRWTEDEVEQLFRRLNDIDTVVIGTNETFCRVCGFDDHVTERYEAGSATYMICPCCERESGLEDWTVNDVRRARGAWIEGGRACRYPKERPADWDPDAALAALPAKWREL